MNYAVEYLLPGMFLLAISLVITPGKNYDKFGYWQIIICSALFAVFWPVMVVFLIRGCTRMMKAR